MRALRAALFPFGRWSSAACAPHPVDLDIAVDELSPAGGDRRRVEGEERGARAGEPMPRQPAIADELAQPVLGADSEAIVQLVDQVSGLGVV